MKSRKSVSDLFRESQGRLDRRPSPQAWQRLERRLDQRNHRRRTLPRTLMMAAALLVLIAFVFVISYSLPQNKAVNYDAFAEATPEVLEDFSTDAASQDEAEGVRKAIVYSHQLHDRSQNIEVQEGGEDQKLMPRTIASDEGYESD